MQNAAFLSCLKSYINGRGKKTVACSYIINSWNYSQNIFYVFTNLNWPDWKYYCWRENILCRDIIEIATLKYRSYSMYVNICLLLTGLCFYAFKTLIHLIETDAHSSEEKRAFSNIWIQLKSTYYSFTCRQSRGASKIYNSFHKWEKLASNDKIKSF